MYIITDKYKIMLLIDADSTDAFHKSSTSESWTELIESLQSFLLQLSQSIIQQLINYCFIMPYYALYSVIMKLKNIKYDIFKANFSFFCNLYRVVFE